ncbi:MAG: right-handed parallel beta-helix repeat-containing protein [Actinomycetota bacterium]
MAIDCATNGDAIEVGRGKYAEVLTVSKDLSISGAGQSATSITSRGVTRELPVISTTANVAIDGLKILSGWGGGIVNEGRLRLNRVSVVGLGRGYALRGITSTGTLVLRNSVVRDHRIDDTCGAGIQSAGTLTVVNSIIRANASIGNCGGGIVVSGEARIARSEIRGNYADLGGGGIFVGTDDALTITHSTITGNIAETGGGLANAGTVLAKGTRFAGNEAERIGGGIWNIGEESTPGVTGSLTLSRESLVTRNVVTSGSGGGIYNEQGATVSISADSSVSGNTPDDCVGC